MKENSKFCLELDARKFYDSINPEILKDVLKKIAGITGTTYELFDGIINVNNTPKDLPDLCLSCGILLNGKYNCKYCGRLF